MESWVVVLSNDGDDCSSSSWVKFGIFGIHYVNDKLHMLVDNNFRVSSFDMLFYFLVSTTILRLKQIVKYLIRYFISFYINSKINRETARIYWKYSLSKYIQSKYKQRERRSSQQKEFQLHFLWRHYGTSIQCGDVDRINWCPKMILFERARGVINFTPRYDKPRARVLRGLLQLYKLHIKKKKTEKKQQQ